MIRFFKWFNNKIETSAWRLERSVFVGDIFNICKHFIISVFECAFYLLSCACRALKLSSALCKFSMISFASSSGDGRLSRSANDCCGQV